MGRRTVLVLTAVAVALLVTALAYLMLSGPTGERSFELVAVEFGYNQSEKGPTLTVRTGDTVTITLINEGEEEHELMIVTKETLAVALDPAVAQGGEEALEEVLGGHPEPAFTGAMIHHVDPGESGSATFVADRPGEYVYGCFVDAPDDEIHAYRGMWGEFVVEP